LAVEGNRIVKVALSKTESSEQVEAMPRQGRTAVRPIGINVRKEMGLNLA